MGITFGEDVEEPRRIGGNRWNRAGKKRGIRLPKGREPPIYKIAFFASSGQRFFGIVKDFRNPLLLFLGMRIEKF
jgi:hypothetical protein